MNRDWRTVRDRIKALWPDVEFDDKRMSKARGGLRKMVSLIQAKTDEPRPVIRRKISTVV